MREKLKIGQKYRLENNATGKSIEIRITNHVGDGASCIVYDGYYLDEYKLPHNVRLKECFPHYGTYENREDGAVQWQNDKDKEMVLERFKMAYMRHLQLQKLFVNSTTHVDELFEANNTRYLLMNMDDGQSYEKVEVRSLHSLLKTLLALSATVKRYHERRLLHLDIKPENFMVIPETEELVKLFDFDSIVSMDEVNDGDLSEISYSERWAAPEVKQRKYRDIKETADIYSVGAILFYYLAGRDYGVKDLISFGRYDWLDECSLLQGVNPSVKKYLTNFLNKTLASAVKMRYQTMDAVCEALKVMIRLADSETMFLKSCLPHQNNAFVGREDELKEIHRRLQGQNCILLNGIGGIGKSELVKEYALRYEKEYSHIVYISCKGSIAEALLNDSNIVISNYSPEEESASKKNQSRLIMERITILKQVVEEDTLFILDDIREFDDTLNKLLEVKCKFILTSREFPRALMKRRDVYTINGMTSGVLMELFRGNYSQPLGEEQEDIIREIILEINHHTLLVSIIAKTMSYYGISPEVMLSRLKDGGIKSGARGPVKHCKDGTTLDATMYGHVESLFDLSGMGENEKCVLRNLAVLEPYAVDAGLLIASCTLDKEQVEEMEGTLNRLLDSGWICYSGKMGVFYLPYVIAEVVFDQLNCDFETCESLFDLMYRLSKALILKDQKKAEHYLTGLMERIDVDDTLRVCVSDETTYEVKEINCLILHCLEKLDMKNVRNMQFIISFGFVHAENKDLGKRLLKLSEDLRIRSDLPQLVGNEYYVMLCLGVARIVKEVATDYSDEDIAKICQCMKSALEYGRKVSTWELFPGFSHIMKYVQSQIQQLYGVVVRILKGQKIPKSFWDAVITVLCAEEGLNVNRLSKEQRRELIAKLERELYAENKEIEQAQNELEEHLSILDNLAENMVSEAEEESEEPLTEEEKKSYIMLISRMMGKTWNEKRTSSEVYEYFYVQVKEFLSSSQKPDYRLIRDILVAKELSVSDKASLLYFMENSFYDVYSKNLMNRGRVQARESHYELSLVKNVLLRNQFYNYIPEMDRGWNLLESTLLFFERKQYDMFLSGLVLALSNQYHCSSQALLALGQFLGRQGFPLLEMFIYMGMEKSHVSALLEEDDEDESGKNEEFTLQFYEAYEACALKMEYAEMVYYVRRRKGEISKINFYKGVPEYTCEEKTDVINTFTDIWKAYFEISDRVEQISFRERIKKEKGLPLKCKELMIQACAHNDSLENYMYLNDLMSMFSEGSKQTIRRERKKLESPCITGFERVQALANCIAEYLLLNDTDTAQACVMEYFNLVGEVFNEKNSVQIMLLFELPDFIFERTEHENFSCAIYQELIKHTMMVYQQFGYYEIKMISAPLLRGLERQLEMLKETKDAEKIREYIGFKEKYLDYKNMLEEDGKDDDYVEFCLAPRADYSVPLKEYEARKMKERILNGGVGLIQSMMKQMMQAETE